jgi:RNA polymerase sigma-70 factor (ECF subfamily)
VTFEEAVAIGSAAWPTISLPVSFHEYLRARAPADLPFEQWLERAPIADLYLTCACGEGSNAALAAFDASVLSRVGQFIRTMRPSPDLVNEVTQTLREKLFVTATARPPKILEYAATGPLASWVRVLSVRVAIDLKRRRDAAPAGAEPPTAAADAIDPEIAHLKRQFGAQFNEALRRALAATTEEQRVLLRLHFVEGVTFDVLAARFKQHKVTVWRKIAAARAAILESARRILKDELKVASDDFESLLRALESQIDISLPSYLKPDANS